VSGAGPLDRICCTIASTRRGYIGDRISRQGCRIVEVRLDKIPGGLEDYRGIIDEASSTGARVIATLRDASEGGDYNGDPDRKTRILLDSLDYGAWLIDVEFRFTGLDQILSSAPGSVLVSAHYNFTPQPELIYATLGEMIREGARIAKLVTYVRDPGENWKLLGANSRWPGRVIAFGMGGRGLISRLLAPLAGAPFIYAGLDSPAAPGQPRVWEVVWLWGLLGIA